MDPVLDFICVIYLHREECNYSYFTGEVEIPKASPLVMGEAVSNTKSKSNTKVIYTFPTLLLCCLTEEGSQAP